MHDLIRKSSHGQITNDIPNVSFKGLLIRVHASEMGWTSQNWTRVMQIRVIGKHIALHFKLV
jgi:hypothetical protein